MDQKVYVAGPMTGIEDHNFPAFKEARDILSSDGHDVVCPAKDDDINEDGVPQMSREEFLRRDFKLLTECEAIALLKGWKDSRGARAEVHMAQQMGLDFLFMDTDKGVYRRGDVEDAQTVLRQVEEHVYSPDFEEGESYYEACAEYASSTLDFDMDKNDVNLFGIVTRVAALKYNPSKRLLRDIIKYATVLYRRWDDFKA